MKKLITTFILGITLTGNAQELKNWQVGINLNPFFFTRIINSNTSYEKDKQDFPNGFGYGITIEKNWTDNWGLKTGVEYCKQNEKYYDKYKGNGIGENTLKSTFGYLKIPLTVQYYYPLKEKLFLTFNQGFQYSSLKYLKLEYDNIGLLFGITTLDSFQNINTKEPSQNYLINKRQTLYNENLFGILGSIGLKGFLTNNISYTTNLRYEYDFTDSDTNKNTFRDSNTTPIHNFRIGLELGLQYNFSLSGCDYCKNQKH
jgi:Outer membrane protein beta-barrel domain